MTQRIPRVAYKNLDNKNSRGTGARNYQMEERVLLPSVNATVPNLSNFAFVGADCRTLYPRGKVSSFERRVSSTEER